MKRWPPEAVPISQITRGDRSRKKAWNPYASSGSWIIPISFAKMNKAPGDLAADDCRPRCRMLAAAIRVTVVKRLRLSTAPSLRETMRSTGQRYGERRVRGESGCGATGLRGWRRGVDPKGLNCEPPLLGREYVEPAQHCEGAQQNDQEEPPGDRAAGKGPRGEYTNRRNQA